MTAVASVAAVAAAARVFVSSRAFSDFLGFFFRCGGLVWRAWQIRKHLLLSVCVFWRHQHTVFDRCERQRSPASLLWADFGISLATLESFWGLRGAQRLPVDVLWVALAPLGRLWLPMGPPLESLWGHFWVPPGALGQLGSPGAAMGAQRSRKAENMCFCVFLCVYGKCV